MQPQGNQGSGRHISLLTFLSANRGHEGNRYDESAEYKREREREGLGLRVKIGGPQKISILRSYGERSFRAYLDTGGPARGPIERHNSDGQIGGKGPEGARAKRRKPRAPGRQNDQKANFIHYFHFNATVSQFMGGPGFMPARIRTTGPNLGSGPHRARRTALCPASSSVRSSVRPSGPYSRRRSERTRAPCLRPKRAGDRKETLY